MYYKEAKPGNICGTPNFIAPEVLNDSVHEPASDIWALGSFDLFTCCLKFISGCVTYTLLSGKPAFEYTNMRDTYKRIVKLAYKIPESLSPAGKITKKIMMNTNNFLAKHLITSILIKDPRRRPMHHNILSHQFITGVETKLRSRTMSRLILIFATISTLRDKSKA